MKKIALILAVIMLFLTSPYALAKSDADTALLSLGLNNIASSFTVRVSAKAGEDIIIVKDDFLRALNKSDIEEIKILSLPDTARGSLYLSGEAVKVGDVIDGTSLSCLNFSPAGVHITGASLRFSDSLTGCEYTLDMFLLSDENSAPVTKVQSAGGYVSTYKDTALFSSLPGYDPDGDAVEFIIVDFPGDGSLSLDRASGSYKYTPSSGFTGEDSFKYVICDRFGAFSTSREVKISVDSLSESEVFSDMANSEFLADAITLTRDGVMSGSVVGSSLMFKPDAEVTRAEFIAMLMKTNHVEAKENVIRTPFYDDSDIPAGLKGYIASAYELGYIKEILYEGKPYLYPNESITRAECAMIIDRMLSINNSETIPVIADIEDCPEDALTSVNALCTACILPISTDGVNASLPLTRGYAAKLLGNVKSFITFSSAS